VHHIACVSYVVHLKVSEHVISYAAVLENKFKYYNSMQYLCKGMFKNDWNSHYLVLFILDTLICMRFMLASQQSTICGRFALENF